MKMMSLFALVLLVFAWPATSADETARLEQIPEFKKVRNPDPAALSVLGLASSQIQRPSTPQSVAVSLSSFLNELSRQALPKGLAVELSPYQLLLNRPAEDRTTSAGKDFAGRLYRMFTISIATGNEIVKTDTVPESLDLGVGFRTRLFDGRRVVDPKRLQSEGRVMMALIDRRIRLQKRDELDFRDPEFSAAENESAAAKVNIVITAQEESSKKEVRDYLTRAAGARRGLLVDFAYAFASRHEDRRLEGGDVYRTSAWATADYSSLRWDVLFFLRKTWNDDKFDDFDFLDWGLRGIWSDGEHAAGLEGVARRTTTDKPFVDGETLWRLAITYEYKLVQNTWLTVSGGKDWEEEATLFSLASIKWGFGKPTLKAVEKL